MRTPVLRNVAVALACVIALTGCSGDGRTPVAPEPACDGAAQEGALTFWTACAENPLASPLTVTLSNRTQETFWLFHECGDELPWPLQLMDDGTWRRLLPPDFFLSIECDHVHELGPGSNVELTMSMHRVPGPGTYRAELMVGRGCVDAHHPLHLVHACRSVDFFASEPFELR